MDLNYQLCALEMCVLAVPWLFLFKIVPFHVTLSLSLGQIYSNSNPIQLDALDCIAQERRHHSDMICPLTLILSQRERDDKSRRDDIEFLTGISHHSRDEL